MGFKDNAGLVKTILALVTGVKELDIRTSGFDINWICGSNFKGEQSGLLLRHF